MTTLSAASADSATPSDIEFVGLAPFLRRSIAGVDLLPIGQDMLAMAEQHPDDANLWMNLATVMLCIEQKELGLAMQAQALAVQRVYHLPAIRQPAVLRLLMLVVPGDLAANTPLDCLLEDSDIDLDIAWVTPGNPLDFPVPEHDALIVGISAADESRAALTALEQALADWPRPVINLPRQIPNTERDTSSQLLQGAPGLMIPTTWRLSAAALADIAQGRVSLSELCPDAAFPVILRPVGSHAGHGLEKIDSPAAMQTYLANATAEEFFLARFVDYRSADGLFRKFRIALIDGAPFACHMGVSANWMVHYVNADMYADGTKREEEAAFMDHFADFAQRHQAALDAVARRTGLDYVCIDCAETPDGQLLIFEIDHAMVVHAMDPEDLFPYKQPHMHKVKDAFRDFVLRRAG